VRKAVIQVFGMDFGATVVLYGLPFALLLAQFVYVLAASGKDKN